MNNQPLIVNLYAGPGAGKSSVRADIFKELKWDNISCEEAPEFAKELVWDESYKILENQIFVFANQHQRIFRLLDKVDVVITDSPILLSVFYGEGKNDLLKDLIIGEYSKMNNLDIFLERTKPYNPVGRMQNEAQAKDIDAEIKNLLYKIPLTTGYFYTVKSDKNAVTIIKDIIYQRIYETRV